MNKRRINRIYGEIKKKLDTVASKLSGQGLGDAVWTANVKEALCRIRADRKYYI